LCQTKGLGRSFQFVIQVRMEAVSSFTDRWVPRRSHLLVSSANQRIDRVHSYEAVSKLWQELIGEVLGEANEPGVSG
jgi:hypothetical protein